MRLGDVITVGSWFAWSGLGICFANYPLWIWYTGAVVKAVCYYHAKVPKILLRITGPEDPHQWKKGSLPDRNTNTPHRLISIILIVIILAVHQYSSWTYLVDRSVFQIVALETSFPLFLLLSFLLPIVIFERYLLSLRSSE